MTSLKIERWCYRGIDRRGDIPGISGGVDVGGEFLFPAFAVARDDRGRNHELVLSNKMTNNFENDKRFLKYSVIHIRLLLPVVVHTGTTLLLAKAILAPCFVAAVAEMRKVAALECAILALGLITPTAVMHAVAILECAILALGLITPTAVMHAVAILECAILALGLVTPAAVVSAVAVLECAILALGLVTPAAVVHKVAVFECAFPAICIVTATTVLHEVTAFGLAATTAFNCVFISS